ncbi:sulfide/dihydroorotate dehydrogenase-like FAD/NAD-binding protein [uncultured Vagococcus sp.]|uniref:sulfide/dihydroorotate dehydrogenase-like FAD/NAD-binding protein n=1 Tax=uncultured Vagococcus sp. TaxID=189676 RepID=UPI0028D0BDA4|nr:sulfide/dihydroorotate dehydrogenase-like FAD/NAD-binding protein [uncultured Vagococcus sp.]
MNKITKYQPLSENEFDIWIEAPRIADKGQPGQFLIVRADEFSERIPLTIVDTNKEEGTIQLIFQVIGKSTAKLAALKAGDTIADVSGPLGMPTDIKEYGTVLLVGGGVGIAALYPIVKGLKEAGNRVITILGAKTAELVILQKECQAVSDELIIMTDDGTLGQKGLVTNAMEEVFARETIDHAWAIGPSMMMKFCTIVACDHQVPVYVSLNPIMIDGTGMCGGCRVTVADSIKFACVDGPEFLGTEVNWAEFIQRMGQYQQEETDSLTMYQEERMAHGETK